jgi:hypothetical protein
VFESILCNTNIDFFHCFLLLQGKEVIEYYINELISEGITYIPPWTDPNRGQHCVLPKHEDAPSQDSGLRSRSNSVASTHSQNSLVLGATAASIHTGVPEIHEPGEINIETHCNGI